MAFTRADILAAAERSAQATGAHDRNGWVGLFTPSARVEDPVGSAPHKGTAAIARFYDTFIGPRDITFHPDVDIVMGATVIRDLELEVRMSSTLTMRIPVYIRYDIADGDTDLKITALSAYWELPAMIRQFLRGGIPGLPAGAQLAKGLLGNQGVTGALGFLAGFRGLGTTGKRRFTDFLADVGAGNEVALRRRLAKGARITSGDDAAISAAELLDRLAGARWHKVIAAGQHLVVGVDRAGHRDVMFAEAAVNPFAINRIRYFSDRD
jgi:hypothetical protein